MTIKTASLHQGWRVHRRGEIAAIRWTTTTRSDWCVGTTRMRRILMGWVRGLTANAGRNRRRFTPATPSSETCGILRTAWSDWLMSTRRCWRHRSGGSTFAVVGGLAWSDGTWFCTSLKGGRRCRHRYRRSLSLRFRLFLGFLLLGFVIIFIIAFRGSRFRCLFTLLLVLPIHTRRNVG